MNRMSDPGECWRIHTAGSVVFTQEEDRYSGRHCFEAKDIRGQGEQMSRKMSRREGSQKDTQMILNSCGTSRNSAPSVCSFVLSLGFL